MVLKPFLYSPVPMPCPGEPGPPTDLIFFLATGDFLAPADFELLKEFIISVGYHVYMTPDDMTTGVSRAITIVHSQ